MATITRPQPSGCMSGSADKSERLVIVTKRWACRDIIDFLCTILVNVILQGNEFPFYFGALKKLNSVGYF